MRAIVPRRAANVAFRKCEHGEYDFRVADSTYLSVGNREKHPQNNLQVIVDSEHVYRSSTEEHGKHTHMR